MTLPLLDHAEREHRMAEASLLAYADLLPRLSSLRLDVLLAVANYLTRTSYEDVTSGELCAATGLPLLTVRPRFTELCNLRLLEKGPVRPSRVRGEKSSHGVRHTVPLAAIERAHQAKAA